MEIITWNISIKSILESKRKMFLELHLGKIRKSTLKNIDKVLDCGTNLGAWSYKCDRCWETKHVLFTCKSRFCNSCSKPQSDLRINKIFSRLPQWIRYNHLVFTIPFELRDFFKRHRKALYILPKTASDAICFFMKKQKKCIPWIIAVIHTFWARLNRNPHVHLLVTHWAFSLKHNTFLRDRYISYKAIRKSRTSMLVKNLKDRCYQNGYYREISFLNTFYDYHSQKSWEKTSWYVYFSKLPTWFEHIIGYIGRYIKRPVIAQSRIINYEWDDITFCYIDKTEKNFWERMKYITCTDIEFLENLVQHIPNENFHMIYYYGIFANRVKHKYLPIINTLYPPHRSFFQTQKNYRSRLRYRIDNDPFKCDCWWCFHKYARFIPWYPPWYIDTS
jgi:hypothetical protein